MATDTLLLMRLYWRLDRREVEGRRRILTLGLQLVFGIVMAVFSGFLGFGAALLVREPQSPIRLSPDLLPGVMFTLVLLGVLITGLNQAVRALFLSGDLDRLMVAPIEPRSVMVAKLLSRLPWNIIFLLLIAAPAFIVFGIGIGAGPLYFGVGLLLLLLAPLFGLSLGAILAMLLVRVLPVNRLNELLAAAYSIIGLGVALLFQLPRFFQGGDAPEMETLQSLGELANGITDLPIPTLMAGRGVIALDQGRYLAGLGDISTYIVITLGLFMLTVFTADRLYLSGWLRTQGGTMRQRGLEEADRGFGGNSLNNTIILKDWLQRIRDPRQLVSLIGNAVVAIVVGGLALFRSTSASGGSLFEASQSLSGAPNLAWLAALTSPGILFSAWAVFVGYMLLSQPASTALAVEGRSFPILKAAPIDPARVWRAKTWGVMIPYMVVVTIMIIVGWFLVGYSLLWTPYAWICALLFGVGMMATSTSAGFMYANLEWDDPRRMTTSGGGFLSLLLTIVYALPAIGIIVLPFVLSAVWPQMTPVLLIVGLGLLVAWTAAWTMWQQRRAVSGWHNLALP